MRIVLVFLLLGGCSDEANRSTGMLSAASDGAAASGGAMDRADATAAGGVGESGGVGGTATDADASGPGGGGRDAGGVATDAAAFDASPMGGDAATSDDDGGSSSYSSAHADEIRIDCEKTVMCRVQTGMTLEDDPIERCIERTGDGLDGSSQDRRDAYERRVAACADLLPCDYVACVQRVP